MLSGGVVRGGNAGSRARNGALTHFPMAQRRWRCRHGWRPTPMPASWTRRIPASGTAGWGEDPQQVFG